MLLLLQIMVMFITMSFFSRAVVIVDENENEVE